MSKQEYRTRVRHHPDSVDLGRKHGRSTRRIGDFQGLGLYEAASKMASKQRQQQMQQMQQQQLARGKPLSAASAAQRGRKADRGGFGLRATMSAVPFATAKP